MGVSSLFRWWLERCLSYFFLCIYKSSPPLLFLSFLCFIFSFKPLQNGDFWNFWRMKVERKVKRIFLLYWDKKTMAAVLIKSSVYAGFSVVSMAKLHSYQVFFLLYEKTVLLFLVLFWVVFLSGHCKQGVFGWLKDKYKRKICGKGRGGCGRQQDSFFGDGGEGFLVLFLSYFFCFWKRRRIIYNLP